MQASTNLEWPFSTMAAKVAIMPRQPAAHPNSVESIAQRLRMTRNALGYNQATISKITGISQQAWNNYEHARIMISIPASDKLCSATGVTYDWIYRGNMGGLPHELATKIQEILRSEERGGRRRA